jgi:putative hemolysin
MAVLMAESDRPVEIHAGEFELRLAETKEEVLAAERVRYQVFYEEMKAQPTPAMAAVRRDFDAYDDLCDHLIVIHRGVGRGADGVVGTYRLIRREAAERRGHFYSVDEYDIARIVAFPGEILELGRSCLLAEYRGRAAMQLMWRGIADYVLYHEIGLMFGCASLPGTDPDAHAVALSYLHHYHLAPPELRACALPSRYVDMNRMPKEQIDKRRALAEVPPLIKGYLRLGGFVGDGAVIDHQFNTTDVFVIVKTDLVTDKYYKHYTREDARNG